MDRDTLKKKLIDILERSIGESFAGIEETTNLLIDLGLDSIDMVSMAIEVQAEFRIELKTEELRSIALVRDILDLIQAKLSVAQSKAA